MAEAATIPPIPPPSIDWSSLPSDLSPSPVNWRLVHGNRDVYYRRAKESGYRARSAYKLLQLDAAHSVFTPHTRRVVDLCAAPGSWSQVAAERLAVSCPTPSSTPRVIAVDLQEMSPISGVQLLQGDVTSEAVMLQVLRFFGGEKVELVLCDGAPDVTGLHVIDEYVQGQLLESVLRITTRMLREGGTFVAKIFKDEAYHILQSDMHAHTHTPHALYREHAPHTRGAVPLTCPVWCPLCVVRSQLCVFFSTVDCVKPASSRLKSAEHFVICKGFHAPLGYHMCPLERSRQAGEESGEEDGSEPLTSAIDAFLQRGELRAHAKGGGETEEDARGPWSSSTDGGTSGGSGVSSGRYSRWFADVG